MHIPCSLLALPPSLLLLLSCCEVLTQALGDGVDLPRRGAHWPQAEGLPEPHIIQNRHAIAERIVDGAKPVAVRKMSEDASEMFFPEYWGFKGRDEQAQSQQRRAIEDDVSLRLRREYFDEDEASRANSSRLFSFRPAFAVHESDSDAPRDPREARAKARHMGAAGALAALQKRSFECPVGTSACISISQPNYCCASGEDCVSITDTGLGPVGCCPSGQSCSGEITNCAADQTACPQNIGGACCIAGFSCFDVGCISSVVVTATATITQSRTTPTIPTTSFDRPTIPTSSSTTPSITSTEGPLPPVRGTGENTGTATATLTSDGTCPTGFYACSAYYPGAGCCRIGRDCSQTSCPSTDSLTVLSSGVTIAVPNVPAATTTAAEGDGCASGWAGCDGSSGCCPSGWSCGPVSCVSAGPTATLVIGKEKMEEGGAMRERAGLGVWGIVVAVVGVLVR